MRYVYAVFAGKSLIGVHSSARKAQRFFDAQVTRVRGRLVLVRLTLDADPRREWGLKELLDDWEEKHGALSQEELQRAERELGVRSKRVGGGRLEIMNTFRKKPPTPGEIVDAVHRYIQESRMGITRKDGEPVHVVYGAKGPMGAYASLKGARDAMRGSKGLKSVRLKVGA